LRKKLILGTVRIRNSRISSSKITLIACVEIALARAQERWIKVVRFMDVIGFILSAKVKNGSSARHHVYF
jgi:hypothetical protein